MKINIYTIPILILRLLGKKSVSLEEKARESAWFFGEPKR